MKRHLLALIAFITILSVPSAYSQFRYAPVAGVTVNNLSFNQDIVDIHNTVGFQAGLMGELMFPGIGFGVDFGLLYNMAGAKMDLGERKIWADDGYKNTRLDIHNILIPVHLRFKWTRMNGLEDIFAPFVYGGPDFNITVGHSKVEGNPGMGNPIQYSGGDLGLTAGGGFEFFKRWQVSLQYTWGMTYMMKTKKLDDYSADSRQWAVRVAYFF